MLEHVKRLVKGTPVPPERVVETRISAFADEIELSDADLEQVVGGLERAYVLDAEVALRSDVAGGERAS